MPTTVLQCRQILELARREGARVHPVGVGHSPSDLACTNGWLVRTEELRGTVKVSTFSLPFSFDSALSWDGRKFLAYAYTTATNKYIYLPTT